MKVLKIMMPALCFCCAGMSAQTDFDSVVNAILANDPVLRASRLEREANIAGDRAENVLSAPELEFEHLWPGNADEKNRVGFSVTQEFEWPGVYEARKRLINAESAVADMMYLSELSDRRLQLRQLLVDVVYARKRIALAQRSCEIFDSLMSKYKVGYDKGEYSRFDYGKIKIERVKSRRVKADLMLQLDQLLISLSVFNGGKPVGSLIDGLEFPEDRILPLSEYERLQYEVNPVSRLVSLKEEAASMQLKADKRALLPGLSLGYRFAREDGVNFHGVVFGIRLPFLYGSKTKLRRAKLMQESAENEKIANAVQLSAELNSDYQYVTLLRSQLTDLTSATDIDECLAMLHKALSGGEISLIQYLLELNYYNEVNSEILDFEYRYHLALIRLNRFV